MAATQRTHMDTSLHAATQHSLPGELSPCCIDVRGSRNVAATIMGRRQHGAKLKAGGINLTGQESSRGNRSEICKRKQLMELGVQHRKQNPRAGTCSQSPPVKSSLLGHHDSN